MSERHNLIIFNRFDSSLLEPTIKESSSYSTLHIELADKINTQRNKQLQQAHALIIRSKTKITEEFLKLCPQLQLIVTATSGFDHIDLRLTQKRDIIVMHTPNAHIASASELTLSLLQCLLRKLPEAAQQMSLGNWNRIPLMGTELENKKVGLVGLGRIGTRVAQIFTGYGCQVQYYDPYTLKENTSYKRYNNLELLLKNSDIVSLHVPLTSETHHIINQKTLSKMPPHAILINNCRGSVIEEKSLLQALENNQIAGACLDVFEKEPLPRGHILLKTPNVVLTPHLGATTYEALAKASQEALEKVAAYFKHNITTDSLPPKAPWYKI